MVNFWRTNEQSSGLTSGGLPHSLVALTLNGVTDKKFSSILIYWIQSTDIYTEMDGVIKTNEMNCLLKMGHF
jgi:hypothetical protein